MTIPNAIVTNTLSDALYALFLLFYFVAAFIQYLKKNPYFQLLIVFFFVVLLVLQILAAYAHYYQSDVNFSNVWLAISLLIIMLNFLVVEAMVMPDFTKISIVFLSIASAFFFISHQGNFLFIAFPVMLVYLIAAYYSTGLLRTGFLMVVASNIIWIMLRQLENFILGHEIPKIYRYDNDLYHLLLIASTFIIYRAILKGYWRYPSLQRS